MSDIKEALWAITLPNCDGQQSYWKVGEPIWLPGQGKGPAISRITVQEDVPGLHCNMRRVCVWVGDQLAVEAPFHSLEAVGYPVDAAPPPEDREYIV